MSLRTDLLQACEDKEVRVTRLLIASPTSAAAAAAAAPPGGIRRLGEHQQRHQGANSLVSMLEKWRRTKMDDVFVCLLKELVEGL